jgi:hypothetical protein
MRAFEGARPAAAVVPPLSLSNKATGESKLFQKSMQRGILKVFQILVILLQF